MSEKFTLRVFKDHEYCELCPEFAVVEISDGLLQRIRRLRDEVERLDGYKISQFEYSVTFHAWDEDEEGNEQPGEEVLSDCHILHVAKDEFWWTGQLKGSGWGFATEEISIDGLSPFREHNIGKPIEKESA